MPIVYTQKNSSQNCIGFRPIVKPRLNLPPIPARLPADGSGSTRKEPVDQSIPVRNWNESFFELIRRNSKLRLQAKKRSLSEGDICQEDFIGLKKNLPPKKQTNSVGMQQSRGDHKDGLSKAPFISDSESFLEMVRESVQDEAFVELFCYRLDTHCRERLMLDALKMYAQKQEHSLAETPTRLTWEQSPCLVLLEEVCQKINQIQGRMRAFWLKCFNVNPRTPSTSACTGVRKPLCNFLLVALIVLVLVGLYYGYVCFVAYIPPSPPLPLPPVRRSLFSKFSKLWK